MPDAAPAKAKSFIIAVDCDGPACVVGEPGRSLSFSCDFPFARLQATREAAAAAVALFDAGAKRVVVWDNHGMGANLEYDRLDERCEVALGCGFASRWPGLEDGFDAAVMIGYHAMEGTPDGVLAHTYSPHAYRAIRVNGQAVGEIALDAAVAGARGVPVIAVASDAAGCAEAARFLPWARTVATKRGVGRNAAFSKHPQQACDEIASAVADAAARLGETRPFAFDSPVRMELQFKRIRQALRARLVHRAWRLAGPRTLRRTFQSMRDWSLG